MSSLNNRRQLDVMKLMMRDYKVELIDGSMEDFYVHFKGPDGSPYHGGVWKILVSLPDSYPHSSPSIEFRNKIYHPNIDVGSGGVCLNVLDESWRPLYDLVDVFELFLPQLLEEPNPSDPVNDEAAELMSKDKAAYEQRVKEYCEKYAKPEDIENAPTESSSDEEMSEDDESESDDDTVVGKADP